MKTRVKGAKDCERSQNLIDGLEDSSCCCCCWKKRSSEHAGHFHIPLENRYGMQYNWYNAEGREAELHTLFKRKFLRLYCVVVVVVVVVFWYMLKSAL